MQEQLTAIEDAASALGVSDLVLVSTDVFVTALCYVGSKSLSHVLSGIERCKERLLSIGLANESARRQIISSVLDYWSERPGVGVNIIDKLLNYTILTPISVFQWVFLDKFDQGNLLAQAYAYEMVANTMAKVTNRVRQIVKARNQAGLPAPQIAMLDGTLTKETQQMKELFLLLEDTLSKSSEDIADHLNGHEVDHESNSEALQDWKRKWLAVFRRKLRIEEIWIDEAGASYTGNVLE